MTWVQIKASLTVPQIPLPQTLDIQHPPFPKFYGIPTTKALFLSIVDHYKSKAYYANIADWSQTTSTSKHLSAAISAYMLSAFPQALSYMFLNYARFSSYRILMMLYLIYHLNPSSSENLLLAINYLNQLDRPLGDSSIDYIS